MGIQNLMKLICDYAPAAVKDNAIKSYFGRKVAIDASMSLYQFLIAVRSEGQQLVASDGRPTGHLMGFFYRTIRMMDNGIKPVYVFDGKPPQMKSAELSKRQEKREEAQKGLTDAEERGDVEDIERFSKRLVKVTKEDTTECMRLLSLMGVPYIEAPCEAEAQCAAMVRAGQVFATATEDMDSLTFGSNVLLRHLTFSEARKMPIREIHLDRVLAELNFTHKEFIDLCILLGCDYCDSVKGVGPAKAVALISQHKSIENILKNNLKLNIPEDWAYEAARELFENPEVSGVDNATLKWKQPDEEGLVQFMVEEKGFSEERIRNGVKKLQKCKLGSTQGRLDSFFSAVASPTPAAGKRKSTGSSAKGPVKKKAKLGGSSKFKR